MNRLMTTVVIAIVLTTNTFIAGAFAAGPQIGTATHGHIDPSQCRFARSDGLRGWTDREVRRTIRCAARRWPVAGGVGKALQVARCESGFETNAYNSGGYAGVFQQAIRYWPDRQRVYDVERWELRPGVFNGRTNVTVSIRMAHRGGWSPWSCA